MPKQKAENELLGSKSCPKTALQNFQEEYNYMYVVTGPKGVHANKTMGVENNVAGRLKLGVFLECAQYWERFLESRR